MNYHLIGFIQIIACENRRKNKVYCIKLYICLNMYGNNSAMTPDGGYAGGYNSGDWGNGNSGWSNAPQGPGADTSQTDAMIVKGIGVILGAIIGVMVLPIAVIAILFYWLFRFLRLRPKSIAIIGGFVAVVSALLFVKNGMFNPFLKTLHGFDFTGPGTAQGKIMILLKGLYSSMIWVGGMIGPWIGLGFAQAQVLKMRNSPWLVVNEGLKPKWMYHFRFRLSPFEIWKHKETVKKIKADTYKPYGRSDLTPLGFEDEPLQTPEDPSAIKRYQVICRAEDEVPKHTMVTGAAGSGKTVTLKSMMTRDIDRHKTIVVIDCKKDPEVAEFLSRRSRESGCEFYHFSADLPYKIQGNPEGPSSYDPLASGSVSKKVDMLLNTREWDTAAAVYRDQAQAYLSKVFATIEAAQKFGVIDQIPQLDTKQGEMWTFTQMLDRNIFNAVVTALNKIPDAAYIRQQASELNAQLSPAAGRTPEGKATQHAQAEYQSKMTGLMVQNYGRWLKGGDGAGSGKIIDIGKLTAEPGNVILFSLDAATPGDNGSLIGSLVCTDLANMTETRKNLGQDNPVAVYIDEFQSLPPECVKSMLQKARSAGVGLTLAFQSLDQVSAATGSDTYVKSLLDTCSNFIFHSGSNYDTGLLAAKIIGTHWKNRYMISRRNETKLGAFNWTNNRDLQVGTQQQEEWIVDPSEFAKLSMPNKQNGFKSEAIIIKKASGDPIDEGIVGATSHKVQMIPPDCVLKEYFDPSSPAIDIDVPVEIRMSKGLARDAGLAMQATQAGVTVNDMVRAKTGVMDDSLPMQQSAYNPAEARRRYEEQTNKPIVSMEARQAYQAQQKSQWDEVRRLRKEQARQSVPSSQPVENKRNKPRAAAAMPMPSADSMESFLQPAQESQAVQHRGRGTVSQSSPASSAKRSYPRRPSNGGLTLADL